MAGTLNGASADRTSRHVEILPGSERGGGQERSIMPPGAHGMSGADLGEVVSRALAPEHTSWMARRDLWCLVLGHRYHRMKLRGRTVLTCKRCGDVDVVTKDMGGLQF